MARREFKQSVKREAVKRSGGLCEASGVLYGLEPDTRCNASLAYGIVIDHILADSNGGEPTLENAAAICKKCNRFKTDKFDTPRAAKTKRMFDKHLGIDRKRKWPKRGWK
jgi:5-methylcytosine-specific restriction enzyme A